MTTREEAARPPGSDQAASPWVAALNKLREWDSAWAERALKMTTNPSADGVLPTKFIELVLIGLNASRGNLNPEGARRHIQAAIAAGASRQEILFVLKCAAVTSIHSHHMTAARKTLHPFRHYERSTNQTKLNLDCGCSGPTRVPNTRRSLT